MVEKRKFPKHLVDLTMTIDRWESEGGIEKSPQGSGLFQDSALHVLEERILRCLGAAVILQWNDLPAMKNKASSTTRHPWVIPSSDFV